MKHIDEVRGFERTILLGDEPRHTTRGNVTLTNCIVEVIEGPLGKMLSLRFYNQPYYWYKVATESAQQGRPLFDADTPIGVEIDLGPELVQSLVQQLDAQLPRFFETVQSSRDDSRENGPKVDEEDPG